LKVQELFVLTALVVQMLSCASQNHKNISFIFHRRFLTNLLAIVQSGSHNTDLHFSKNEKQIPGYKIGIRLNKCLLVISFSRKPGFAGLQV